MKEKYPSEEIPVRDLLSNKSTKERTEEKRLSKSVTKRFLAFDKRMSLASKRGEMLSLQEVMPRAYKIADMIHEELTGDSVCKKGCAHCCKVPVTVTAAEIAYINQLFGTPINSMATPRTTVHDDVGYCPLLDKESGTCTVYEARPLACRSMHSYDSPEFCKDPTVPHLISTIDSNAAIKQIAYTFAVVSENSDYATYADIRDWVIKND